MDGNVQANNSPLCVFCLSPSFSMLPFRRSVTPTPRRRTFTRWRRGECVYPKIRSRFKPSPCRTTYALPKYLAGRLRARKRDVSLQEVLYTLRLVWTSPKNELKSPKIIDMDDRLRKTSNIVPSEVSSPVLLRRRLSAPETIMRKHMLAQQRSEESQESDATQVSDCRSCQWRMNIGSDSNLSRKRDSSFMRKSTLLRKLWSNSKNVFERSRRFSTAYSEWQYSCGKLSMEKSTLSLNSDQSSPEHLKQFKSEFRSPKRTVSLTNSRKLQSQDLSCSKSSASGNKTSYTTTCTTNTPKTITTESESETTTRRTGTSTTSYSDNSDSAYTNSQSNFSQNSETVYSSETQYAEEDLHENDENANEVAGPTNTKTDFNDNSEYHRSSHSEKFIKYSNTSVTHTSDTANLNVISNVQLSQSTLDLIFNHVLQDVHNKKPSASNSNTIEEEIVPDAKIIKVQQMPSFYLKRKEDVPTNPEHNRIIKYMISNVGTGSPYSKPAEVPQIVVPRYSALPRTSSMEVNTSSGDSTDKESDTISLVDSLEDPMSPRGGQSSCVKHDEKPVRGDLSLLLPDNSDQKKSRTPLKPSAFFISIENSKKEEGKAVADHLPAKVREKLSKRHMKRELQQKKNTISPKSDSNYISASDNGNHVFNSEYDDAKNILKYNRARGKILPNVQTRMDDRRGSKQVKRKSLTKTEALQQNSKNRITTWSNSNSRQRLAPVYINKNQCTGDETSFKKSPPKKDAGNTSKRLDYLQVVESVEEKEHFQSCTRISKSKIPILVQQKLPKLERKPQKPVYLDFDKVRVSDPKIDQLIANILIDTLNKCDESKPQVVKMSCEKRPATFSPVKTGSVKYQQKFEVIPEELSHQSSLEENANRNVGTCVNGNFTEVLKNQDSKSTEINDNINKETDVNTNEKRTKDVVFKKEKETKSVGKDDNSTTVPQGWITFYMLHKNQGSPDSTSDEGTKKSDNFRMARKKLASKKEDLERTNNLEDHYIKAHQDSLCDYDDFKVMKGQRKILETLSSSDALSENVSSILPLQNGRYKKQHAFRKCPTNNKEFPNSCDVNNFGQWSVTVSGTNSHGQSAPEVEMRLKFPQSNKHACQYQSDSGIGEENDRLNDNFPLAVKRSSHLLKRAKLQQQNCGLFVDNPIAVEDNYKNGRLPVITQNPKRTTMSKRCDSSIPINSVPFRIEPRQTKTSSRRYALSRPKNLSTSSPRLTSEEFLHLNAERQLAAILSRFPEVLSVNGNSISPERKPRVSKMSERDLTRSFYNGH